MAFNKINSQHSPVEKARWEKAAKKKFFDTGSSEQSERYADHISKAAIHRRRKAKDPKGIT